LVSVISRAGFTRGARKTVSLQSQFDAEHPWQAAGRLSST
jgi:hypothetical protein